VNPHENLVLRAERAAYRARLEVFLSSRDASCDLTAGALRGGITPEAIVRSADDVAQFCDEAVPILLDEYRPSLDCQQGCSFCCRKPGILVSIPELLRIVTCLDAKSREAVAVRAREYVARMAGRDVHAATSESVPCPLLVDDRCSVYEKRPLVCRGYNSTSVDACRHAHGNAHALVPIFAMLKDATDGATVGMVAALAGVGLSSAMLDLGHALHLVLDTGEGEVAARILADQALLAPARHATWADDLWASVQATARELDGSG